MLRRIDKNWPSDFVYFYSRWQLRARLAKEWRLMVCKRSYLWEIWQCGGAPACRRATHRPGTAHYHKWSHSSHSLACSFSRISLDIVEAPTGATSWQISNTCISGHELTPARVSSHTSLAGLPTLTRPILHMQFVTPTFEAISVRALHLPSHSYGVYT